jgi:DNA-binding MarR family transcriptional regulator
MAELTLSEFADKVSELMPVIMKEFIRHQVTEFDKLKITMPQAYVLDMLSRKGEWKMSDLAKFINVTTAAMTGIIDRLVKGALVTRAHDPEDRRIVRVRLTPKGEKLVSDILAMRKEITVKMFGMISQAEREEYLRILAHIHEHLNEEM